MYILGTSYSEYQNIRIRNHLTDSPECWKFSVLCTVNDQCKHQSGNNINKNKCKLCSLVRAVYKMCKCPFSNWEQLNLLLCKKTLGISFWVFSLVFFFFFCGRKCPLFQHFSVGTLPYVSSSQTRERLCPERGRAVSQVPLSSLYDQQHSNTWLRHSLSPSQAQVWPVAVANEFSMPRKVLNWYLSKHERRKKEVLQSVNYFPPAPIHWVINNWKYFKEGYTFLLSCEILATFPSI